MDGYGKALRRRPQRNLQRELGLGILRQRRRKGWSQALLAQRLEVSRHRLGKWERGLRAPSLEDLAALLAVLEVTFEELIQSGERPVPQLPSAQRQEATMYLNAFLRSIGWVQPARGKSKKESAFGAMKASMSEGGEV